MLATKMADRAGVWGLSNCSKCTPTEKINAQAFLRALPIRDNIAISLILGMALLSECP